MEKYTIILEVIETSEKIETSVCGKRTKRAMEEGIKALVRNLNRFTGVDPIRILLDLAIDLAVEEHI